MAVLKFAKDKILVGKERKTAVITPETAKRTTYHNMVYAFVGVLMSAGDQQGHHHTTEEFPRDGDDAA